MQKIRYPGVSPFTSEQQNIFYGRAKDIKKLQKLISLRNQVLVYAKSGIGKTSLLNAGVLPLLENKFNILKIRFTAYNNEKPISPVENIINLLETKFQLKDKNTFLDQITKNTDYKKTLWHYFKQNNLLNTENEDFILVFDQFEELFSYPEKEIQEFKNQMHDLINDNLPNLAKQFIAENPEIEDQTEVLFEDLNIKTVFAIRSDRLSLINKLTDKLPDIQKNFYELNPLDNEQAKQAIINPAKDKGDFETKIFEFENSSLDAIINALSNNGKQNIETTQLQIICERIENIAQEKHKNSLNNEVVRITEQDLPQFDDIFLNFYHESVKKIKNLEDLSVLDIQKFIEDQLIRNHQRISLDEIICTDYVSKEILLELVNSHLLRSETNSTGGFSYELSHDTLIEPILISRKKRIEKEEELQAEKERIEELRIAQEKAEQERIERKKEQKRQRTIIAIVGIAAVISILFGIFGFVNMKKAENALLIADEQRIIAQEKEDLIKKNATNYYLRDANSYLQQKEFKVALSKYIYLRDTLMQGESTPGIDKRIVECEALIVKNQVFDSLMDQAKIQLENKDYKQTVDFYAKALDTKMNNDKVISQLKDLLLIINDLSNEYSDKAKALERIDTNKATIFKNKAANMKAISSRINKLVN